jgi:hypothetical protein
VQAFSTRPRFIESLEARIALSSIAGIAWSDDDGDGIRGPGEPVRTGWEIYLDQNRNRVRDSGELFTVTDAQGNYHFDELSAGTYYVGQADAAAWRLTSPGEGLAANEGTASSSSARRMRITTTGSQQLLTLAATTGQHLIHIDAFQVTPRVSWADGHGYSVAVLDSGINASSGYFGPDNDDDGVADRIVYRHNFVDNNDDASDLTGHGTDVAALVAGYTGVANQANIVALKVVDDYGFGTFGAVERALQWVIAHAAEYKIAAVNTSFSDGENWNNAQQLYGIGDEIAALTAMKVMVISAAGNKFHTTQGVAYPAADPNTIAVGAVFPFARSGPSFWTHNQTDFTAAVDGIAAFSQRSTTMLDVFAPGVDPGYGNFSGTSQASAHVAGLAVLAQQLAMSQLGRRLTLEEFRSLLTNTGATIFDGDDENDDVTNTNAFYKRVDAMALGDAIYQLSSVLPFGRKIELGEDSIATAVNFGAQRLSTLPIVKLAPESDTGASNRDRITKFNNATSATRLLVSTSNIYWGATVTFYLDGVAFFSSRMVPEGTWNLPTSGISTTTSGNKKLADGLHVFTARQQLEGETTMSDESLPLIVTIDATAPTGAIVPKLTETTDTGYSSSDAITTVDDPMVVVEGRDGVVTRTSLDGVLVPGGTFSGNGAGQLTFRATGVPTMVRTDLPIISSPYEIVTDDFNNDGNSDVLTMSDSSKSIAVALGNGDGTFRSPVSTSLPNYARRAATADFNEDGWVDVVVRYGINGAAVLFGDGSGRFGGAVTVPLTNVLDVATARLGNHAHADILVSDITSKALWALPGNGDGTFGAPVMVYGDASGVTPDQLLVMDVDDDSDVDLMIRTAAGFQTLRGNSDGSFQPPVDAALKHASAMAFGDFDGDGTLDAMGNQATYRIVRFFKGLGDGSYAAQGQFPAGINITRGAAADFNGDGFLDYATCAQGPREVNIYFGNGDGTLAAYKSYTIAGDAWGMSTADFNNDGHFDLVTANHSTTSVTVLVSRTPLLTEGSHFIQTIVEDLAGNTTFGGRSIVIDHHGPQYVSSELTIGFNYGITVHFNEDARNGMSLDRLTVQSPGGATPTPSSITFAGANMTFEFPQILADGTYHATLNLNGVKDLAGNPIVSVPAEFDFFILGGDANRDGVVDAADLGVLALNWNRSSRNFSQGDFNFDRRVNVADLKILAANWQMTSSGTLASSAPMPDLHLVDPAPLPPPPPSSSARRTTARTISLLEPPVEPA